MKALLKIEWIKTWRSWPVFIMSIGMPVGFFLLYSGMEMGPDPERTFKNQYSGLLPIKNLPSSYEFYGCYHRNFLCRSFCA